MKFLLIAALISLVDQTMTLSIGKQAHNDIFDFESKKHTKTLIGVKEAAVNAFRNS